MQQAFKVFSIQSVIDVWPSFPGDIQDTGNWHGFFLQFLVHWFANACSGSSSFEYMPWPTDDGMAFNDQMLAWSSQLGTSQWVSENKWAGGRAGRLVYRCKNAIANVSTVMLSMTRKCEFFSFNISFVGDLYFHVINCSPKPLLVPSPRLRKPYCIKVHTNKSQNLCVQIHINCTLTPKVLRPVFCSFLKCGQPILVRVLMLNF